VLYDWEVQKERLKDPLFLIKFLGMLMQEQIWK
jgi:hypothetical protein